jgi:hypothetical protein
MQRGARATASQPPEMRKPLPEDLIGTVYFFRELAAV